MRRKKIPTGTWISLALTLCNSHSGDLRRLKIRVIFLVHILHHLFSDLNILFFFWYQFLFSSFHSLYIFFFFFLSFPLSPHHLSYFTSEYSMPRLSLFSLLLLIFSVFPLPNFHSLLSFSFPIFRHSSLSSVTSFASMDIIPSFLSNVPILASPFLVVGSTPSFRVPSLKCWPLGRI